MTSGEDCLTLQEAYLAMFEFMAQLYQRTVSDEVGSVLGDLSMLADGTTADPAAWETGCDALKKLGRAPLVGI